MTTVAGFTESYWVPTQIGNAYLQTDNGYQALEAVLQMPSVFTEESDVRLELRFQTIANQGTISKGDTLFQWFSFKESDGRNYSLSCTSTAMGNNTPFYV